MCNHIHISILHHIPHVVYTSIYIIIYIYIYFDHILYILFALVTHLILFLAGPSRATCPTSYSSWMQRHSVCRLENWGTMGGTKRILLAVHPQIMDAVHQPLEYCGRSVLLWHPRSFKQSDWSFMSHWQSLMALVTLSMMQDGLCL